MTKEQSEKQMLSTIVSHMLGQEEVLFAHQTPTFFSWLFLTFHSQNPLSFLTLKAHQLLLANLLLFAQAPVASDSFWAAVCPEFLF